MIKDNIDLSLFNCSSLRVVTRICDNCGKEEKTRVKSVLVGRQKRNENIDLCFGCSNRREYKKQPLGNLHGLWKHGKTKNGYLRITSGSRRILKHKDVMEKHLRRELFKGECVHHIDGNKLNNDLSNLCLFNNNSEHHLCHASLRSCGYQSLGKYVFFDPDNKKYSLNKCRQYDGLILSEEDKHYIEKLNIVIQKPRKRNTKIACVYFYNPKTKKQKYKKYHVLLAEKSLKRRLFYGEHVHHINGNTIDNELENLFIVDKKRHSQIHYSLDDCCFILYRKGIISFDNELKKYVLNNYHEV